MKITKLHFAIATALFMTAGAANAIDGTINVKGAISANTCKVSVNNGTGDADILLPTVSATALPEAGKTAGQTAFVISLTDCAGATLKTAQTYFEAGATVTPEGRLKNKAADAGKAGNVEVELVNAEDKPIVAGAAAQNDIPVDISGGSGDLHYAARYYATDKVTAGDVTTFVNYSVVYD